MRTVNLILASLSAAFFIHSITHDYTAKLIISSAWCTFYFSVAYMDTE